MPTYSQEFRRTVIQAVRAGESVKNVALRFQVSESSVRRWANQRYRSLDTHGNECMCFTCLRYRHT